ncbi:unnamed protein product [Miscanthus lutarioriparius]|uniref:Uncharacterized protein n=1 Tax=Miscanthus lutarioriparius TaxID=422564 RepID=A0A811SIE6_9POAL|nr:unnamed protein product [Miscanthus lutarioriparius]
MGAPARSKAKSQQEYKGRSSIAPPARCHCSRSRRSCSNREGNQPCSTPREATTSARAPRRSRRSGSGLAAPLSHWRRQRPGVSICLFHGCGLEGGHGAQVCGLEGGIAVSCGGTNGISGAAAVSWPLVRYLQLQWQVSVLSRVNYKNLMNLLGYCI